MVHVLRTVFYIAVLNVILVWSINYDEDPTIQLFQEYVRINTTTQSDLTPAVEFWKRLVAEESLPISVYEYVKGFPVVVIKWAGTDSSLSSVMLNSHMDVVPADEEDGWKYPPFDAEIDENGDIYGRGTQDMKFLAIYQFEALRRLKNNNISLLRDVYMTLMPDEEIGGLNGMGQFVKSEEFAAMNVGVEMDEGLAQPNPATVDVVFRDKAVWHFTVDCYGISTHGSRMVQVGTTAIGKCLNVANQFYNFREEQSKIAKDDGLTNAGEFTSINLNKISGGTATNIIPGHVKLTFDVRLGVKIDENELLNQFNQWIKNAGDNITLTFITKTKQIPGTIISDSNPYWRGLTAAASVMNITLNPLVITGAIDGRYLRAIGIPAFGFSPIMNTPLLAHRVDERLNAAEFLKGLEFYAEIVKNLANIPANDVSPDSSIYLERL